MCYVIPAHCFFLNTSGQNHPAVAVVFQNTAPTGITGTLPPIFVPTTPVTGRTQRLHGRNKAVAHEAEPLPRENMAVVTSDKGIGTGNKGVITAEERGVSANETTGAGMVPVEFRQDEQD